MSVSMWAKRIAVVGALAFAGISAHAATITFDFSGSSASTPTMSFNAGGLDLLVSASHYLATTGAITGGGKITQTAMGLGEKSGALDSSDKMNTFLRPELLLFNFSSNVVLQSITFAGLVNGSKFVMFMDDVMQGNALAEHHTDLTGFNLSSDSFGIGVYRPRSGFRIESMTVSTVPLPAGAALLGSGLVGLSLLRRKRRAAGQAAA